MAFEFRLPDLGEGVAEGEVVKWLVAQGDTVDEDQPLVEVMTDKATVEIPSPRAGRIERLGAGEGEIVPVGHVLVVIDESMGSESGETGDLGSPASANGEPESIAETTETGRPAEDQPPPNVGPAFKEAAELLKAVEATPAVRSLAKELGVDLRGVTGTGRNGRITADDVRGSSGRVSVKGKGASPPAPSADEERVPLRGLRKRIAEAMKRSVQTAPQFTFVAEADVSAIVADRENRKSEFEDKGIKLTFVSYLIQALPESLKAFPYLNASLDDEHNEIVLKKRFNIAIAVATPEGLTVPIVANADQKDLTEIAGDVERLAEAARTHKLKPEELSGATFTVTTTGAKGGVLATPIVHHPQVAILGVHAITEKPVVRDGEIVIRDMVNLSLSLDHRVVDGQIGAEFLYHLIASLEAQKVGEKA